MDFWGFPLRLPDPGSAASRPRPASVSGFASGVGGGNSPGSWLPQIVEIEAALQIAIRESEIVPPSTGNVGGEMAHASPVMIGFVLVEGRVQRRAWPTVRAPSVYSRACCWWMEHRAAANSDLL
jgi:hypothetical protein